MFEKTKQRRLVVALTTGFLLSGVAAMAAISMETVPIGDLGNPGDTAYDGHGSVNYGYEIGTYEVTAGQYTEFLNAVAETDTYGLYNSNMETTFGCRITQNGDSPDYSYDFSNAPGGAEEWEDRPVNYVSWGDAARFANWMHNGQPTGAQGDATTEDGAYDLDGATSAGDLLDVSREPDAKWFLPTLDEWYKAAYYNGTGYYDYPTGTDEAPTAEVPDGGENSANFDFVNTTGNHYRTEVGAYPDSDSPYGTFDQGGNVEEWHETDIWDGSKWGSGYRAGYFGSPVTALKADEGGFAMPTDRKSVV